MGGLNVIRMEPPPDSHALRLYAQALLTPSDPPNIYSLYNSQLSQLCTFKQKKKPDNIPWRCA